MNRSDSTVVARVRAGLENEPGIDLHHHPIELDLEAGALVLEGEVASVAAKKRALRIAASEEAVRGIVDRLRVSPSQPRSDGEVRDVLGAFLTEEPELRDSTIVVERQAGSVTLYDAGPDASGRIVFSVVDGVVRLDGEVISLSHKRLVGVLAWWTPGCRDVVNSLAVSPPEEDNDGEVLDALGLVYEIDPTIGREQIHANSEDRVVTLTGTVGTEAERHRAEEDAWALYGVDRVINRIEVRR